MTVVDVPTDHPDEAPTEESERPSRHGALTKALVAMAVVGLLLAGLIVLVSANDDTGAGQPLEFVVPVGTGDSMFGDDAEALVPALIRLEPSQQLVLRNEDWRPHTLGPLTADRGATVRTSFPAEGRYVEATSLRPDGRVTILVEDTSR